MRQPLLLAATVLGLAAFTSPGAARRPTVEGLRLGDRASHWNARACVGELGWHAPLEACTALVWVHVKRARDRNVTVATMARLYSQPLRRPPRSRAWVMELDDTARPPVSWPPTLERAWPRYRRRFRQVLTHVREVLHGRVPDPCPDAIHYGGPMDSIPARYEEDPACVFEGTHQRFMRRVPAPAGAS